jgi:hypothetical protein
VEEETDGGEDADRWGPHVSERKGKKVGAVSVRPSGPLLLGQIGLPWSDSFSSLFFCAVSFLIFCFLFLSQILHFGSKQVQTTL